MLPHDMKRILVSVWCLAVWLPVPASGADRIYSTPVLPMMIDNSLRFLLKKAK
jgi:hypothetical protein